MSDKEALRVFARQPVSQDMIDILVTTTKSIIQVRNPKPQYSLIPSVKSVNMLVGPKSSISLVNFIKNLIKYSNVQTPTLMATLVYLNKLRNILPANAIGMETTRHRIFLAALIVSAKSLNDQSPLNKHWTKYTDGLLTNEEVNMAERELIGMLKWDISIKEDELIIALQPFLTNIKDQLVQRMEEENNQKLNYYRLSNSFSNRSISSRSSSRSSLSSYNSSLSLKNSHSNYSLQSSNSSNSSYSLNNINEDIIEGGSKPRRIPLSNKSTNLLNLPYSSTTSTQLPLDIEKQDKNLFLNLANSGRIISS
ncbi:uncharacterized protein RJT21DRAFT_118474 [Scheffersomyces amazonensis]|uniref:uncharacterized protein n=1 Tax=Scheffersomyces amazonensis TaxID=1078765 RepID=UPI00315D48F2